MADVMVRIPLTTARTRLGELIKRVERNEMIIITNHGADQVAIVPMAVFWAIHEAIKS